MKKAVLMLLTNKLQRSVKFLLYISALSLTSSCGEPIPKSDNEMSEEIVGTWVKNAQSCSQGSYQKFSSGGQFEDGAFESELSSTGLWSIKDGLLIIASEQLTYEGEEKAPPKIEARRLNFIEDGHLEIEDSPTAKSLWLKCKGTELPEGFSETEPTLNMTEYNTKYQQGEAINNTENVSDKRQGDIDVFSAQENLLIRNAEIAWEEFRNGENNSEERHTEALNALLEEGICWGRNSESQADYSYHRCGPDSIR